MTTRKARRSKKRHLNKKDKSKKRHRHHKNKKRTTVSWKDHYTYESPNPNSNPSSSPKTTNKNYENNGNIVNGLRDFLALKKDKK